MNMKKLCAIGLVVFAFALSAQLSFAQQNPGEWLVGWWEGALQDFAPKEAAGRTMKVTAVAPDGTAQGLFGGGGKPGKAQIKLEGPQVKVITGINAVVVLNRTEEGRLEGTFTWPDGRAFPVTLMKIRPSTEFDGKWTGTASPTFNATLCASGSYELTVKDSAITGSAVFLSDRNYRWESTISGGINPDKTARLQLTPKTTDARGSQFGGVFEGNEFKAKDDNNGKAKCIYMVSLKKK
jgi:hypothetical protein